MRGCHTKEDIHDEEVIIEVPLKCLITVEMGKETEVRLAPLLFAYVVKSLKRFLFYRTSLYIRLVGQL